jgi:3-methylcrotonyl-CoA carboxylase alpha subunit
MFHSVLVANRGEIAVRVMQACAELGCRTVAVYSDADAGALHVRRAGRAVRIGPAAATQSYLNVEAIVAAALQTGAEAVHPGYGFLSENPAFARACLDAGLTWIGPSPEAMEAMASKIAAKRLAVSLGIPVVTGYDGADQDPDRLSAEAERIGVPLLIKASAGGGGRGMRLVQRREEFADALAGARREALAAFGDDAVLLERYLERPRHIEIQVFGDRHGSVVHLGERECSIQRRNQKVIEEAPSTALTPALREEMGAAAVRLARAIGYTGAGTVEFLLDADGGFHFLEMNTRLQVEHGVTELVTGLDLVHLQLRVAAGEPLPFVQDDMRVRGHAIQCRVYAEDAAAGFVPSTGRLTRFAPPAGAGIRNDIGVETGDEVTPYYDAMLAKLLVVGATRDAAVERMAEALRRYEVHGVTTNLPLLLATVEHLAFRAGATHTAFLDEHILAGLRREPPPPEALAAAAAMLAGGGDDRRDPWRGGWRHTGLEQLVTLAGEAGDAPVRLTRTGTAAWRAAYADREVEVAVREGVAVVQPSATDAGAVATVIDAHAAEVAIGGRRWRVERRPPPDVTAAGHGGRTAAGPRAIVAPLTGTVVRLAVTAGQRVEAGQPVVVLDAMKMEHTLTAATDAVVEAVHVAVGDLVQAGATLATLAAGT